MDTKHLSINGSGFHPGVLMRARNRRGVTMLELVIAGSMLAGVMTSLSVVMRTARQSWETSDQESAKLQQMHAVTRHFVRATREARSVASIDSSGTSITLEMRDGSTTQWAWKSSHQSMSDVVTVRSSTSADESVLARNIRSLQFTGFEPDGVTAAASPEKIHVVSVAASVNVPDVSVPHRIESKVWIRSW